MNEISRCLRGFVVCGFLTPLGGCGTTTSKTVVSPSEAKPPVNFFIGKQRVYADLIQGPGGNWMLKTVSSSDNPPDKGYLVVLNDLTPSFDTRVAECEPQAYPENHKCNPAQPFRSKHVGVMSKIISGGISAGTAGKVTQVSRTYKTTFDEPAFNQAVDEALINTGLRGQRREFLGALERYDAQFEASLAELSTLDDQTRSEYNNTGELRFEIRPSISGLTRYYSSDIDFHDLVHIETRSLRSQERSQLTRKNIVPCEAKHCVQAANAAFAELSAATNRARLELQSSLADETADYALRCDSTSHLGYTFTLACPATVSASSIGTEPLAVNFNILSRDFDGLYPVFLLRDENLTIDVGGGRVRLSNNTTSYLSISAQTVYYNTLVETHPERIEIAPGATIDRAIDSIVTPAIRIESSYRQMTPGKAAGTSFRFGFAAKYRLAGANGDTTLYDLRDYNLGCVIDNRIRPGSCQQEEPETGSPSPRIGY